MVDMSMRMMELAGQGYECSQIMMILALELEEKENPDLIRAMSGLNSGMGRSGNTCGCLTAGACILGYFTGKGESEEIEDSCSKEIVKTYVEWFQTEIGAQYGGCSCGQIVKGNYALCMTLCKQMLERCFEKIMELLIQYDILVS